MADILQQSCHRAGDLAARFGGEEFLLLLPHMDVDGARYVAEQVINGIKSAAIPHDYSLCAPYVTVSLGIAVMTPKKKDICTNLITLADAALYQAKSAGRNSFVIDESNVSPPSPPKD